MHKDFVRKLRPHHEICQTMPPSVQKIIGGDLSQHALKKLAQEDALELLYIDTPRDMYATPATTRARARRQQEAAAQRDGEAADLLDEQGRLLVPDALAAEDSAALLDENFDELAELPDPAEETEIQQILGQNETGSGPSRVVRFDVDD